MKRTLALILAVMIVFASIPSFSERGSAGEREKESAIWTLVPSASDGVTVCESGEGSMRILAHENNGALVFDETKDIAVTVTFGEGWLRCDRYSDFFAGDERVTVTELESNVIEYRFAARSGERVKLADWYSVAFNASAEELPKLYIDAAVPFEDIDKENWVEASFTLTLGTKEFASGEYEGTGSVKGRGNSSWTYPKKPYSIKLDSKASLLDIPKTKKYAIVPSYYDGSLMRNFITYKVFQGLEGIGYVPKCEFVDVYLNGDYNGIYILVERIDIEKSKIDIEEANADNLTGGYLIEKDVNGKVDFADDLWFDCPYWANQSRDYFVMKAPEPDDGVLTETMLEYLSDYMQRIHNCIIGGDGTNYLDYVDTSSWVDFIIVQEVSKNIDGNMKTSCYMYKLADDDHLYMTAPWDFDLAYGRVTWDNASDAHNDCYDCPPADTADGFMCVNSSNPWMDKLYDAEPAFRSALMERYTEYRHTLIDGMFAMIREQAAYLTVVQAPNYQMWGHNFHNGVRSLNEWLTARVAWLDSQWLIQDYALGDINMDGSIDAADALMALRIALGLVPPTDNDYLADMNGNGTIEASDALIILRMALGVGR